MNANAVVDLDCNVQIQCIDRYGKVIRTTRKHNKATVSLVEGILRFLKGDFNATRYTRAVETTPDEAEIYIPVRAQFGRIGVKLNPETPAIDRRFDHIDTSEFVYPTFDSYELQEPISPTENIARNEFKNLLKFSKIRQAGYTDNNNAECLEFSLYINPGKLVGYEDTDNDGSKVFVPYNWSYYNPRTEEYETMLTEVGLLSSSDVLLARVLFEGEVKSEEFVDEQGVSQGTYPAFVRPNDEDNPIVQSQSTTIVLVWRIGIVSVSKKDDFITQNNLTTTQFVNSLTEAILEDGGLLTRITGKPYDEIPPQIPYSQARAELREIVDDLLNNNDVSVVQVKEETEDGNK